MQARDHAAVNLPALDHHSLTVIRIDNAVVVQHPAAAADGLQ
ncbi:hypothetical protein [Mycobacteroides abscessus]|nr:hypothetical protein [Mycobacteroides abscessus]MDM2208082.1 hypothetical protein [Mycobacteroides abscessus]MDM2223619.1 hypothetical protein [Mycobacteroides abscessus]MDM2233252.1 hypothetical protein [Mycobacteroides abscessus]MDM2241535.1 hypothetical protein [Mycobacteroides abscessus]MDM2250401.1 hypothetical protein [Mycobacteroides abscessus]